MESLMTLPKVQMTKHGLTAPPLISLILEDSFQADAGIVRQRLEQGWHLAVKEKQQWESSIGFVRH